MLTNNKKQMPPEYYKTIQNALKQSAKMQTPYPQRTVQVTVTEKTERQVTYTYLPTPISVDGHQIVGSTRSVLPQIVDAISNVDTQALMAPQEADDVAPKTVEKQALMAPQEAAQALIAPQDAQEAADAAPKTVEKQALDAPQKAPDVAKKPADVGVKPYFSNAFLVLMTVLLVVYSGFIIFFANETKQFFCDVQGICFRVVDVFFRDPDDDFYTMFTNRLEQKEMEQLAMEEHVMEQQAVQKKKDDEIAYLRVAVGSLLPLMPVLFFLDSPG
jgi:hypothetical protein